VADSRVGAKTGAGWVRKRAQGGCENGRRVGAILHLATLNAPARGDRTGRRRRHRWGRQARVVTGRSCGGGIDEGTRGGPGRPAVSWLMGAADRELPARPVAQPSGLPSSAAGGGLSSVGTRAHDAKLTFYLQRN